jgi:hypothetical protein
MSKKRLVLTDPAEAAVVDQITVRLVRPDEEAEWDRLMVENHYLKSARMVGEQLRYVAEYQGRWMALLGWSAAAYHLKGRDGWIGWNPNQRRARLHLVANNARFCRLEEASPYPRACPSGRSSINARVCRTPPDYIRRRGGHKVPKPSVITGREVMVWPRGVWLPAVEPPVGSSVIRHDPAIPIARFLLLATQWRRPEPAES